jgi:uncharacterized protein YdhG (YjbR/CyaY superfamily)
MNKNFADIDSYIASFPPEVQEKLEQIRNAIRQSAPEATEAIKYAIPTSVWHGNLVHFAAFKSHIGFYPAPTGMAEFEKELAPYKQGKGSVQFPMSEELPLSLVSKIVAFRIRENSKKQKGKK